MKVVISSGHGKHIRGASGFIDEVDEARKVVETTADYLREAGIEVTTYHERFRRSVGEPRPHR
jgi:N-acetylmuramoyl-L-alanine amidase